METKTQTYNRLKKEWRITEEHLAQISRELTKICADAASLEVDQHIDPTPARQTELQKLRQRQHDLNAALTEKEKASKTLARAIAKVEPQYRQEQQLTRSKRLQELQAESERLGILAIRPIVTAMVSYARANTVPVAAIEPDRFIAMIIKQNRQQFEETLQEAMQHDAVDQ